MEERISTYELGKWRAQLRAIQEELELLTEHFDLFEVYERNNPSIWKYRGGTDAQDLLNHLMMAGESIDRIANLN